MGKPIARRPVTSAPISLYLDLVENESADIEAVARAAIAFSRAIKDAAYIFDPSGEVSVKLVSGTESSLSLNSIVEVIKSSTAKEKLKVVLIGVLLGTGAWFTDRTLTFAWEKLLETETVRDAIVEVGDFFGLDLRSDTSSLSDEEIRRIADRVSSMIRSRGSNPHVAEVFKHLDVDPAVKGAGVTTTPMARPKHVVPKERFRGFYESAIEFDGPDSRVRREIVDLRIVSPRLIDDERRWKFIGPDREFGATVEDDQFRSDFVNGQLSIDVKEGIYIQARVRIHEKREGKAWVIKSSSIEHVFSYQQAPYQHRLFSSMEDD